MKIKLAVIGGGSVNWMRGLMRDVYTLKGVDGGEIRLVDPNVPHVTSVKNMLLKFNELTGKTFDVSVVEDRREAMAGCDFVLTTFSPGAMDAFFNDLEIPVKYGVRLPVSMTCGISGISAALRTVPVAYEITQDMEEVCPGAVLLNVTNPMTAVTKAFNLPAKTVTVYGICHEINALEGLVRRVIGISKPSGMDIGTYLYSYLNEQGFDYAVAGINHYIWLVKANLNGENVLDKFYQYAVEHNSLDGTDQSYQATNSYVNNGQAKLALCRQLGYLPIPGDRHLIEFWPSLCNNQTGFGMKYGVLKTTVDSRRLDKVLQKQYIDRIASGEEKVTFNRSGEEIISIMQSYLDKTEMITICNRPNIGQISNLPEGAIVETLVRKEKDGSVTPIPAGELPRPVHHLCYLHTGINEMVVEAALKGDRKLLVEAMSIDPSTGTMNFSDIPQLCDYLLNANKQWLPRFFN
ncbi:MAG: hypothetical protein J5850_02360 [Clostridia bacterium]|nr:hypothetical protein [Clostridia bacterium]